MPETTREIDFNNLTPFVDKYNIDQEVVQRVKIISQLTKLREESNLTQKDLASKTGLTQAQISKIEKGKTNPNLETLLKIANFFKKEIKLV